MMRAGFAMRRPGGGGYLYDVEPFAFGVSLRKLRGAYSGACIQAVNPSGTTQDIGFSGDWLDESALTTFAAGGNVGVRIWYDQSGNGFDVAQTAVSLDTNKPRIVDTGALTTVDGYTVIPSQSTVQLLSFSSGAAGLLRNKGYGALACVCASDTGVGRDVFSLGTPTHASARLYLRSLPSNVYELRTRRLDGESVVVAATTSSHAGALVHVYAEADYSNGTARIYMDNGSSASASYSGSGNSSDTNSFTNSGATNNAAGLFTPYATQGASLVECVLFNAGVSRGDITTEQMGYFSL